MCQYLHSCTASVKRRARLLWFCHQADVLPAATARNGSPARPGQSAVDPRQKRQHMSGRYQLRRGWLLQGSRQHPVRSGQKRQHLSRGHLLRRGGVLQGSSVNQSPWHSPPTLRKPCSVLRGSISVNASKGCRAMRLSSDGCLCHRLGRRLRIRASHGFWWLQSFKRCVTSWQLNECPENPIVILVYLCSFCIWHRRHVEASRLAAIRG